MWLKWRHVDRTHSVQLLGSKFILPTMHGQSIHVKDQGLVTLAPPLYNGIKQTDSKSTNNNVIRNASSPPIPGLRNVTESLCCCSRSKLPSSTDISTSSVVDPELQGQSPCSVNAGHDRSGNRGAVGAKHSQTPQTRPN